MSGYFACDGAWGGWHKGGAEYLGLTRTEQMGNMTVQRLHQAAASAIFNPAHRDCRNIARPADICTGNADWIGADAFGSKCLGTGHVPHGR